MKVGSTELEGLTSNEQESVIKQIIDELRKTRKQVKDLESVEGLIDADLVRSTKAMFYEKVLTIAKQHRLLKRRNKSGD